MASNRQKNLSSQEKTKEAGQENILRRVASMPLISSTYDIAATAYSSTKDSHSYVKSILDAAEKGVKTLTGVAINTAQPVLNKLESQIAIANKYASKGLDILEKKLPVLQLTANEVASNTKEMVSNTMAIAKEAMAEKLSRIVDKTKEAVEFAISHHRSHMIDSKVGQIIISAESILDSAEEAIDDYIPMTDEEKAKLEETVRKEGNKVVVKHNEQEEYLVRLGSLSGKLRGRAYRHSIDKLKRLRQKIQSILLQLQETIQVFEFAKHEGGKKQNEHLENLHQLGQELIKEHHHTGHKEKFELCSCLHADFQALMIFQKMIMQLLTNFKMLRSSIQGFPSSFQEKIHQLRQSSKELHSSVLGSGSIYEIPDTILNRSYQIVGKAQEYMEELREYITHHTPLSWFVGPFTLPVKQLTETAEPGEQKKAK